MNVRGFQCNASRCALCGEHVRSIDRDVLNAHTSTCTIRTILVLFAALPSQVVIRCVYIMCKEYAFTTVCEYFDVCICEHVCVMFDLLLLHVMFTYIMFSICTTHMHSNTIAITRVNEHRCTVIVNAIMGDANFASCGNRRRRRKQRKLARHPMCYAHTDVERQSPESKSVYATAFTAFRGAAA